MMFTYYFEKYYYNWSEELNKTLKQCQITSLVNQNWNKTILYLLSLSPPDNVAQITTFCLLHFGFVLTHYCQPLATEPRVWRGILDCNLPVTGPGAQEQRYSNTQDGFMACGGASHQRDCISLDPVTGTWQTTGQVRARQLGPVWLRGISHGRLRSLCYNRADHNTAQHGNCASGIRTGKSFSVSTEQGIELTRWYLNQAAVTTT